uniref:Notch ligand N-terminal domain-containing protein n=1 Tax=Vespula pensylvanica TaxID=30213 RepID=A0A834P7S3_VESPE|nr:hypothetical protein H0235_004571 [Vespula pensylvanica]
MSSRPHVVGSVVSMGPQASHVNASGVFELRLKSFVNEYGKDSLGKCCSGTTSRTGECSGVCKTRFRVCLKQYQVKIDTTTPCTYGDVVTPVLGENIVNLSPNVALPSFTNPIRFPFEFTWPAALNGAIHKVMIVMMEEVVRYGAHRFGYL